MKNSIVFLSIFTTFACGEGNKTETTSPEQSSTETSGTDTNKDKTMQAKSLQDASSSIGKKGPLSAPEDVGAAPTDAMKTASGLAYKTLQKGTGTERPSANSSVSVHYTGWTTDGKMFDSSVMRGQPATFGLNQVIAGWTEGVQLMTVGEKTRFWIPEELAYKGRPGAPQGMLVFDVELLEIK